MKIHDSGSLLAPRAGLARAGIRWSTLVALGGALLVACGPGGGGTTQKHCTEISDCPSGTQCLPSGVCGCPDGTASCPVTVDAGGVDASATDAGTEEDGGTTTDAGEDAGIDGGTQVQLVSIAIAPPNPMLALGNTLQLTATGTFSDESETDVTQTVSWASSNTAIATVTTTGEVHTVAAGTVTITATEGSVQGTATLTVNPAVVTSLSVTPSNSTLALGESLQLHATASLSDGSNQDVTTTVSWVSMDTRVAVVSVGGLVQSMGQGTVSIAATLNDAHSSASLTIGPAVLRTLAITGTATAAAGLSSQLTATGTFSDNTTPELSSQVTWHSDNEGVATVSSSGLVHGVAVGTAHISAVFNGINAVPLAFVVTSPVLQSIAITPANPTVPLGGPLSLVATGTYSDGSTQIITTRVAWASQNTALATISTGGVALGRGLGTTTITASSSGITTSVSLVVGPPAVTSFTVSPTMTTLALGQSFQLVATGSMTDGTTQTLTTQLTWSSNDSSIVSVTTAGRIKGLRQGTARITVTAPGVTGSANVDVTVGPPVLESVVVSPANMSLPIGEMLQLNATAVRTDGSTYDVTQQVSWASSDPAIAIVLGSGGVRARAVGTATISVDLNGVSGSTHVTVLPAAPASVAISPIDPSIPLGKPLQFVATGTLTDGTIADETNSVQWLSSDSSVAVVTNTGAVQTLGTGTTTITARIGDVQDTTTLTVTEAELVTITVGPANPSLIVGATLQLSALGTWTDGRSRDITSEVGWQSGTTSVATVSLLGLVRGRSAGSATITATSGAVSGTANLLVLGPSMVALAITPSSPTVAQGGTRPLTATATYSDGSTQNLSAQVTWSTGDSNIATVSDTGLLLGKNAGQTSITATFGSLTATVQATVTTAVLSSISVTPSIVSLALGTSQQLTATGTLTDGTTQDLTNDVTWSSASTNVATVSALGLVKSKGQGVVTITATSGMISGTARVTVGPPTLVSIGLSPQNQSIPAGNALQLAAVGDYTDGSTQTITSQVTWTTSDASKATVSTAGLVRAATKGLVTITATSGSITSSIQITVLDAVIQTLAVTPASPAVPLGAVQQLTATGTYTDGTQHDLTSTVVWTSSAGSVASISNSGLVHASAQGSATITASTSGLTATAQVTVGAPIVSALTITPANASVPLGSSRTFTATATYTDSTTQDLSSQVTWSSSAPAVAIISTAGVAQSKSIGNTTISAALGAINTSTTLTVKQAALVSIVVSPANTTIPLGSSRTFTATGTYTDSTTSDITGVAAWTSSNTSVADASTNGVVATHASGAITLTASLDGVTGSTNVTVGPAVLASLALSPATKTIPLGTSQQIIATGTYTDGSTQNLSSSVTWTSSAPAVATVSAAGQVQSVTQGNVTITASTGGFTATSQITVTVPDLVAISISPSNGTTPLGRTLQLTAVGTFSDQTTQVLPSVTWQTSAPLVAVVTTAGLLQSLSEGMTTITATFGSVSGTTQATVTAPEIISIAVTPASVTVPLGNTTQLTATATYTNTTTQNISSLVTWTSANTSVATVGPTGLVQSKLLGTVNITAAQGSISGSSRVTVGQPVLTSVAITPANPFLALGRTQTLTATGTYSDGTTRDVTSTTLWSLSNSTVATISGSTVTSKAKGSSTITATVSGVQGTTTLTVGDAALTLISVTPTGQTVAKGRTLQLTATGMFSDGSTKDLSSLVDWSSSDASKATVSSTGLFSSVAPGQVTITATSGSISGTVTVTVGPAVLTSIALTPANQSIPLGTTLQLTATGTYSDQNTQDLSSSVTWTSSNTLRATISAAGLVTSKATGTVTITATLSGVSTTTQVTIGNAVLVSLGVTPASPSIALGTSQQFVATGTFTDNTTQVLTSSVTWTTSSASIATISTTGSAQSVATGVATITASYQGLSASAQLTVNPAALVSIAVTPSGQVVPKGATVQLTATGTYTDSTTKDVTSTATWTSSNASFATVTSGLVKGVAPGVPTITAAVGAISGNVAVTVASAALVSITVTPASATLAGGATQQLTATGTYTDNSVQDLTTQVAWSSSSTSIATVSTGGLITASNANQGTATITATKGTVSGSMAVVVGNVTLLSIAVTPANPSVALGLTKQLKATGTYSDNSTLDISSQVTWSSDATSVATVSTAGLVQSQAVGPAVISATLSGVTGSTTVTVGAATLVSIAVTPASASLPLGNTVQLTATGTYTDNTTADLSSSVTWTSSNTTNATVSTAGLVSSKAVGSATITATSGGITGSSTVTVTAAALVSLALSPTNPSLSLGQTQQMAVTGTYTNGSTQNLTSSVAWTSSDTAVATVSAGGLVTSKAQGTATITATSGSVTASTTLTVGAVALVSIAITPSSPSVALGNNVQLTATGTYTNGSTQNLTSSVTWSSSNTAIATISSGGLVHSVAQGSTTITATLGAISSTATINVTGHVLLSIAVTPANTTIPLGNTQQFTATGTYTDGATADLSSSVTWNSSTTSVATVAAGGLVTSKAPGLTTITATLAAVSGSTTLTVGPAVLKSIAITPANPTLPLGNTQQLVATGTLTDGTTQVLTSLVTWASSATAVATISSGGLVSSLTQGSTSITATQGSITGTVNLTVGAPALVSIAVTPAAQNIPLGNTVQMVATGTYTDSSTQVITSSVTWSSSTTSVATITSAGLVTSKTTGTTTLTAALSGITGSTTLTVSSATLVSIAVTPASPSIALGRTQQLVATGTLTDGTTINLSATASWTSSSTQTATVSTSGLVTSKGIGSATITATSGGVSGTASVTVTDPVLASISLTPSNPNVALGNSVQLAAIGTLTDGTTTNLTSTATWASSNTNVATVGAGLVQSKATGSSTITVTSGTVTSQTTVNVGVAVLASIAITPANGSVPVGSTLALTATGTYTDSTTRNITTSVTWSSSNVSLATITSGGVVTGKAQGPVTITAALSGVSTTTTVTVAPAALVSLSITPTNQNVALGNPLSLTATGRFTDNTTQNLTTQVTWTTSDSSIATVTSAGIVQTKAQGTATITATQGAVTASTSVTVGPAVLVSIAITPSNQTISLGSSLTLTATGTFSDGTTQTLSSVTWTSSATGIASVSASGVVQSVAVGSATITAAKSGVTATTQITVGAAGLVSVAVTPAQGHLPQGTSLQMKATGTYTDNSTRDITAQVTWSSDLTGTASVTSAGLVQGRAQGTATISAAQGSISGSTSVTVDPPALASIAISPASTNLPLGLTTSLTAKGTYTDGSTLDLTSSVTWSSSATSVATINQAGLVQSKAQGATTITAALNGVSGTASVSVVAAVVTSIDVQPSDVTVPMGATQPLTATGTFSDGTSRDISSQVAWSSNNVAVATVNTSGQVHAVGQGAVTITAATGEVIGTAQLVVGPAVLQTIVITPSPLTIKVGLSQQLAASGVYTDGTTINVTSQVTWASSNQSVAAVTSLGHLSTVSQGNASITATLNGVIGTLPVTVDPPGLVSLAITPSSKTIALGSILQLTATGTYTDNSTVNLTSQVTWSSSDAVTAAITTGGLVQSLAQGAVTITAAMGTTTTTAQVTVGPPAITAISVSPDGRTIPTGATLRLSAQGTYTNATTADVTSLVTWLSSNTAVATVSSGGVVTGAGGGTVTITATSNGVNGSVTVTVLPASLVSLAVTPGGQTVALGVQLQLMATGTLSDSSTVDLSNVVSWSSSSSSIATVSSTGLVISRSQGLATISVSTGSVTGSTTVTVTPAALVSIAITPANPQLASGTTLQLSAVGTYTDGSTRDLTTQVTWASSASDKASVDVYGLAHGLAQGVATVTATSGNIIGSTQLTVLLPVLQSIAVTPANATIPKSTNLQLIATGTYSDGSKADITSQATWSSSSTSIVSLSTPGLAFGVAAGTSVITATLSGVSASTNLTILSATLVNITIDPNNVTVALGRTQQMTAKANLSNSTQMDVTGLVTWSVAQTTWATITSAGLFKTVAVGGPTTVSAQLGTGYTATSRMTVGSHVIDSVAITPAAPTIAKGATTQLKVTATYSDGLTSDVTTSTTWSSSATSVATVNTTGLARGQSQGTATITANVSTANGSGSTTTVVTVGPPALFSLAVSPDGQTIYLGNTLQLTATGTYTDGSTQDATSSATWSSSDATIASVSSTGLVQSKTQGAVTITATSGTVSSSVQVTVGPPALSSISLSPDNGSVPLGVNLQLTATGHYTDGTSATLAANTLSWTSLNTGYATVSTSGLVRSVAQGTATIRATLGALTTTTQVTVSAPVLTSIAISPSTGGTVPVGTTLQLSVMGTLTNNSTTDLTSTATWTSSNPAMASVASGLVTGKTQGTVTITASSGGFASQVSVIVAAAALQSITISPATQTIAQGNPGAVTATGSYSDGSSRNITTSVGWGTSDGNIASISTSGVVTTSGQGTVTVTAVLGAVMANAQIVVGAPVLTSIALTPASQNLPVGSKLQLTATGTLSNGSTQTLTGLTWTSGSVSNATVNSSGEVTAVSSGLVTITATTGTITGTVPVNVVPAALVSLDLSPGNLTLPKGSSQQYTVKGTYTDGSVSDLSSQVSWLSSDETVAKVSSLGLVQSYRLGTTHLSATLGGLSVAADITVGAAVLSGVSLSVPDASVAIQVPKGKGYSLDAIGIYTDGTQVPLTADADWSSSVPSRAIVSLGVVQTLALGTTVISATYQGLSGTAIIQVVAPVLVSIRVSPSDSSVPLGINTLSLTATAVYSDASELDVTTASNVWFSTAPAIATVSATGHVTPRAAGSTVIFASYGDVNGFASVTVMPPILQSLTIEEDGNTIPLGRTTNLTAVGHYSDGSTGVVTDGTWVSDTPSVGAITSGGSFHAVAMGLVGLTVTSGTIVGTGSVMVGAPTLEHLDVTPPSVTVPLGATQQLLALGTYTDGSTADLTSSATWTSDNTGTATVSSGGLVMARALGAVHVTATNSSLSGQAVVTVGAHAPLSLAVTPDGTTVPYGATQQMKATLTYTDGLQSDVTASSLWSSSATTIATVTSTGLLKTVAQGGVTIQATYTTDGVTLQDTADLTIGAPTLNKITVTPSNQLLPLGSTIQMKAKGTLTDGSTSDLSSQVTWSTGSATIATITSTGSLHAATQGGTTVTATLGSVTGSTNLTVVAAALSFITITPDGPNIPIPNFQQVNAIGTYTDGTTQDLTLSATWISSNASVCAVSTSVPGFIYLHAISQGHVTITVSSGSVQATTVVTVGSEAVTSVTISPVTPTVPLGGTQQMTATGTFTDGSTQALTSGVTWTSSNTSILTVTSAGVVKAVAPGSATITGSSGGHSDSTLVTVGPVAVASIEIIPGAPTLAAGLTQQLVAKATYTDGSTGDVASQLTWTSGTTSVATISSTGALHAVSIGTAMITARDPSTGVTTSVTATVTARALVSIQLMFVAQENSPPICGTTTYYVPQGEDVPLVALGRYSDGAVADLTVQATWTSSSTAIATVENGVVRTAVPASLGSATITASLNGVSGTAVVSTHL